jgi:hypothetical protein
MEKNNWEPSAMEKLHMEKGGGAIDKGVVKKEILEPGTRIKVTVYDGKEESVHDFETLFLVGIQSMEKTADGKSGKAGACIRLAGCLDKDHAQSLVMGIEHAKKQHPDLMMADMMRMIESVSKLRNPLDGMFGGLGDIFGGNDE